jgi:hypothetical protein
MVWQSLFKVSVFLSLLVASSLSLGGTKGQSILVADPTEENVAYWLANKVGDGDLYVKADAGEGNFKPRLEYWVGKNPLNKKECEIVVVVEKDFAFLLVGDQLRFKDLRKWWAGFKSKDNNFLYYTFHRTGARSKSPLFGKSYEDRFDLALSNGAGNFRVNFDTPTAAPEASLRSFGPDLHVQCITQPNDPQNDPIAKTLKKVASQN